MAMKVIETDEASSESSPTVVTTRLTLVNSGSERQIYRRTELAPISNSRVRDIVVREYDDSISRESLELYMAVTQEASDLMRKSPRRGYLGSTVATKGNGIEFRWEVTPIDRIKSEGNRSVAISEYRKGIEADVLYDLRGERLHQRIDTLDVDKQEVLRWLAEQVFSQEEERNLLAENMDRTSSFIQEQLGVTGVTLTPNHTRFRVLLHPDGIPLVILEATDISEHSIRDIHRTPRSKPEIDLGPTPIRGPFREPMGDA